MQVALVVETIAKGVAKVFQSSLGGVCGRSLSSLVDGDSLVGRILTGSIANVLYPLLLAFRLHLKSSLALLRTHLMVCSVLESDAHGDRDADIGSSVTVYINLPMSVSAVARQAAGQRHLHNQPWCS